ncbi:MAG: hypothetical protein KDK36_01840, partial [Leptospiraceae bacterium]|nr:hypothetical protein [Leptospiraceae bacterium]
SFINLTHLSLFFAIIGFFIYTFIFNLKILFLFFIIKFIETKFPKISIWVIASIATLTEIFNYQLFPWYYGNLLSGSDSLKQICAVFGIFGLSFISFLGAYILLELLKLGKSKLEKPNEFSFFRKENILILTTLTIIFVYGWLRVNFTIFPETEFVNIGIVQPNTAIGLKEKKSDTEFVSRAYIKLARYSLKAIYDTKGLLDLLILPESAAPFYGTNNTLDNKMNNIYDPNFHAIIAFLAKTGKLDVLYNEMDMENGKIYNSASIFNYKGERKDTYRKRRLVPLGEYLPSFLNIPILKDLFNEVSNYSKGDKPKLLEYSYHSRKEGVYLPPINEDTLSVLNDPNKILESWEFISTSPKGLLGVLICYEGLFTEDVLDYFEMEEKPDFFVNIVNDSWFGNYLENYQHSDGAKIRAVETGRFFIRSTLGGVSSVTDPLGRKMFPDTKINTEEVLPVSIPRVVVSTLYLKWGKGGILSVCFFALFIFIIKNRKSIQKT